MQECAANIIPVITAVITGTVNNPHADFGMNCRVTNQDRPDNLSYVNQLRFWPQPEARVWPPRATEAVVGASTCMIA